jgi:hypothetical protein
VKPSLQRKSNRYHVIWVNIYNRKYPAWNAHAPYCNLWSVWLYNIFPHYLINGTIFENKLLTIKRVIWFPPQLCLKCFSF